MNGTTKANRTVTYGPLGPRVDLIELMTNKGWSTLQLAHEARVAHETVRRVIRGYRMNAATQRDLATALGVNPCVVLPLSHRMPGVAR